MLWMKDFRRCTKWNNLYPWLHWNNFHCHNYNLLHALDEGF